MNRQTGFKFGVATAVIAVALVSAPAFAQGQPTEEALEADDETIQNNQGRNDGLIVVTGSRIASPAIESAQPLQILSEEAIDDAGVTNIQEILAENPVFGAPGLTRTNSAFLTSGTGVATIDLRNLGSERTLVLIDGRRVVGSLAGSPTVDLNVIPTQFIQRIDILTGGASSLYGSDAIAGVVNFVYKTGFEGIEANGQIGVTEEGDDVRYQTNVTFGANSSDGRGNIMAHVGYSREKGLLSRQRDNTRVDDFDLFRLTGDPADFGTPSEPFFSSFPPQGRFITAGGTFTFDANNNLQRGFSTNGNGTIGPNGFNRQNFRTIAVPVERYLFAAKADYEITDGVTAFAEATFNRTSASRIIEPFPLESGGSNGIFPSGGGFNIENFVSRDFNGDGVVTRQIVINPFVPGAISAAARDSNGDGLRDIGFTRRLAEFGPRSGSTDRDFYRFVVGLNGNLFEDRFRWDLSYNYGQVLENQVSSGQVNVVNFRDALAVQQDFDDLNGNGLTTDFICVNAEARANNCAPANIFGAGSISQDAVDFIQAQGTFQTNIKQHVVQGNISGSLFELPAGPLGVALGVEYRKEESTSDNDSLTNQGLNGGNVLPDTSGQFDVREVFGEIRIPILSDRPFFESLEIGAAGRISDYSTIGTVYTYSGSATWQPIRDLRLRGTYARAVRAPNIGELFAGLSQTFPSGLTDPCAGIGATGGGALGDNCRASPGVAANIAGNGVFTLNQADLQGISGFNGGNPDLEEERSDSYTAGVVINPVSISALRNLTLTVDYYNISIENVIAGFPRQFTLDQCFGQGNQTFCDLITRRPGATAVNSAGSIDLINALQVNAAILETEGLDATLNYYFPFNFFGSDGRINARVAYTHTFNLDYTPLEGGDVDPAAGEIGASKDRFTANLGFTSDTFGLSFTGTYFGPASEDDGFCSAFDLDAGCFRQDAEFYLDMQAKFFAGNNYEFYLGVDNLLDNDAPNLLSGTSFNVTGTDTAANVYDVFGRRYYTGVRLKF